MLDFAYTMRMLTSTRLDFEEDDENGPQDLSRRSIPWKSSAARLIGLRILQRTVTAAQVVAPDLFIPELRNDLESDAKSLLKTEERRTVGTGG